MPISPLGHQPLRVAAAAQLPFDRLTAGERRRLTALLTTGDRKPMDTRMTATGRFVSRLNAQKRVLWTNEDGRPTILSIVDHTYRSET